jgi:urea transport system substrate-binding protein
MNIYMAHVNEDHTISIEDTWPDQKPYWLSEIGCDLTKTDNTTQFTIDSVPNK